MIKFKKIQNLYSNYGFRYAISYIINQIISKFGILSSTQLIDMKTNIDMAISYNNTVLYGFFRGMKLSKNIWWGASDTASKIFGQYESHILNKIIDLSEKYNTFIDIGAADGYYAIGLVNGNYYEKAICFEIANAGRLVISENAKLNNVESKISILGAANLQDIVKLISDFKAAVVLVDIEGAEFDLLDEKLLYTLRNCAVIIELHDSFPGGSIDGKEHLINRASKLFDIEFLNRANPEINNFSELFFMDDNSRFLLFSEGRPTLMEWICLTPKKN